MSFGAGWGTARHSISRCIPPIAGESVPLPALLEITELLNHSNIGDRVTGDISHCPLLSLHRGNGSHLLWLTGYCCFSPFISDTWNHHCQKCLLKCFHSWWHCRRILLLLFFLSFLLSKCIWARLIARWCLLDVFFQGARITLLQCKSILRNCFHHSSTLSPFQRNKQRKRGEELLR